MGRRLTINGFWLFAQSLRRRLRKQGGEFPGGTRDVVPVASHYWDQMDRPAKLQWKRHAKEYSRTGEFKALRARHKRLHANSPSRRKARLPKAASARGPDEETGEEDSEEEEWVGPNGEVIVPAYDSDDEGFTERSFDDDEPGLQLVAFLDALERDSAMGDSVLSLSTLGLDSPPREPSPAPPSAAVAPPPGVFFRGSSGEPHEPPALRCALRQPSLVIEGLPCAVSVALPPSQPTATPRQTARPQLDFAAAAKRHRIDVRPPLVQGPPPGQFDRAGQSPGQTSAQPPRPALTKLEPPPGYFRQSSMSPPHSEPRSPQTPPAQPLPREPLGGQVAEEEASEGLLVKDEPSPEALEAPEATAPELHKELASISEAGPAEGSAPTTPAAAEDMTRKDVSALASGQTEAPATRPEAHPAAKTPVAVVKPQPAELKPLSQPPDASRASGQAKAPEATAINTEPLPAKKPMSWAAIAARNIVK